MSFKILTPLKSTDLLFHRISFNMGLTLIFFSTTTLLYVILLNSIISVWISLWLSYTCFLVLFIWGEPMHSNVKHYYISKSQSYKIVKVKNLTIFISAAPLPFFSFTITCSLQVTSEQTCVYIHVSPFLHMKYNITWVPF